METKTERFERIAGNRLEKISHALGLMGNLTNSAYASTEQRRAEILEGLQDDLHSLAERWGILQPSTPAPAPAAPPPLPCNAGPVANRDKTDIRVALETLTRSHGPADPGVAALRRVVLGWATNPTDQETDQ